MQFCEKCGKELSKSNKGGLCQSCYYKRNDERNATVYNSQNNDELMASNETSSNGSIIDVNKNIVDLTVADLVSIIREQIQPLATKVNDILTSLKIMDTKMAKISKDNEDNTENINKNCNDINALKAVALEQQKSLESYKR